MLSVVFSLSFLIPVTVWALHAPHPQPNGNISHYGHAHSYSPVYTFHKRDGWETVSVSDLAYKYVQSNATNHAATLYGSREKRERRSKKPQRKTKQKNINNGISGTFNHVFNAALKGIGKLEQVTITWCVLINWFVGMVLLNSK